MKYGGPETKIRKVFKSRPKLFVMCQHYRLKTFYVIYPPPPFPLTVRKEIKCSRETQVLHELVQDATRKSESHELFRVVHILVSPLHFICFPTVHQPPLTHCVQKNIVCFKGIVGDIKVLFSGNVA